MKRVLIAITISGAALSATAQTAQQKRIAHGEYLVTISGCQDCHSPNAAQICGSGTS
jgi:mono/diheme cytochrome c family protein